MIIQPRLFEGYSRPRPMPAAPKPATPVRCCSNCACMGTGVNKAKTDLEYRCLNDHRDRKGPGPVLDVTAILETRVCARWLSHGVMPL